jgi:hypothetical protein
MHFTPGGFFPVHLTEDLPYTGWAFPGWFEPNAFACFRDGDGDEID